MDHKQHIAAITSELAALRAEAVSITDALGDKLHGDMLLREERMLTKAMLDLARVRCRIANLVCEQILVR
jgi:hypothetical protein